MSTDACVNIHDFVKASVALYTKRIVNYTRIGKFSGIKMGGR